MEETAPIFGRQPTPEVEQGPVEVRGVDDLEGNSIASVARAPEKEAFLGRHPAPEVEQWPVEVRGVDEPELNWIASVAEALEMQLKCPVCLVAPDELMVLECGHFACEECTMKWAAKAPVVNLSCPVCTIRARHIPQKCELMGSLLKKLKLLEESIKETSEASFRSKEVLGEIKLQKFELKDVICYSCNGILYKPSVLNCGHVFCQPCVLSASGTTSICKACGVLHPGSPNICNGLAWFMETFFASEYKAKAKQAQISSSTSLVETMSDDTKPDPQAAKLSEVHVGVGCDSCGVYPIQGKRYSCKICENLDLCEKCSSLDNVCGRSGQFHSIDHMLELNDSFLLPKVLALMDEMTNDGEARPEGFWW